MSSIDYLLIKKMNNDGDIPTSYKYRDQPKTCYLRNTPIIQ